MADNLLETINKYYEEKNRALVLKLDEVKPKPKEGS